MLNLKIKKSLIVKLIDIDNSKNLDLSRNRAAYNNTNEYVIYAIKTETLKDLESIKNQLLVAQETFNNNLMEISKLNTEKIHLILESSGETNKINKFLKDLLLLNGNAKAHTLPSHKFYDILKDFIKSGKNSNSFTFVKRTDFSKSFNKKSRIIITNKIELKIVKSQIEIQISKVEI